MLTLFSNAFLNVVRVIFVFVRKKFQAAMIISRFSWFLWELNSESSAIKYTNAIYKNKKVMFGPNILFIYNL